MKKSRFSCLTVGDESHNWEFTTADDAVVPMRVGARSLKFKQKLGGRKTIPNRATIELESLILAQSERLRRA